MKSSAFKIQILVVKTVGNWLLLSVLLSPPILWNERHATPMFHSGLSAICTWPFPTIDIQILGISTSFDDNLLCKSEEKLWRHFQVFCSCSWLPWQRALYLQQLPNYPPVQCVTLRLERSPTTDGKLQLVCLEGALENSTCAATNQTCICLDASLQTDVATCVAKSCTVKESLGKSPNLPCFENASKLLISVTKNVTETTCDAPIRNKSKPYYALSISFGTISGAIVALRLFSKFLINSELGLDDYFIALTLGTGIPSSVLTVHGIISNGLGRDIWTITPKQITDFIHVFYAMEILYFAQVALLKLSLLFFYLRIFPGPKIRRLLWATVISDVCFGIVFVFIAIFQCRPISYYWKNWDGEHQGTCLNVNSLGWTNAAISILLDAWMLGLPMSQLVALQLHWKKKIGVGMMFVVGTL